MPVDALRKLDSSEQMRARARVCVCVCLCVCDTGAPGDTGAVIEYFEATPPTASICLFSSSHEWQVTLHAHAHAHTAKDLSVVAQRAGCYSMGQMQTCVGPQSQVAASMRT